MQAFGLLEPEAISELDTLIKNTLELYVLEYGWFCESAGGTFVIKKYQAGTDTYVANVRSLPFPKEKIPYAVDAENPEIRKELEKTLGLAINTRLLKRRREGESKY